MSVKFLMARSPDRSSESLHAACSGEKWCCWRFLSPKCFATAARLEYDGAQIDYDFLCLCWFDQYMV